MRTILSIAGFDPSSGAGVTADLAVIAAHGFFGTACITALTVQSTVGVKRWQASGADLVADSLAWLADDLLPSGVKIGMLADAATVRAVAAFLGRLPASVPVVLDPVLRASSGKELLAPEGVATLREKLLPRVSWVTPNVAELSLLSGEPCESEAQIEAAAALLAGRCPGLSLVATGGELPQPDDLLLPAGRDSLWLKGQRVQTRATHGTGCAFSSALLCGLVRGQDGESAARAAKSYVEQAMRCAFPMGAGKGPMNLYWPLSLQSP